MNDQQRQQAGVKTTTDVPAMTDEHRWGESISEKQKEKLGTLVEQQKVWLAQPEAVRGKSPFDGDEPLTGAEVAWLAEQSGRDLLRGVPNLHLEGARIVEAHLEGADLIAARLENANLGGAYLENADLGGAHLEGATLAGAHLEGATLAGAHLERAYLRLAHLEGADLIAAHLERANLIEARLDANTVLSGATLDDTPPRLLVPFMRFVLHRRWHGPVSLADAHWNGASITTVDWSVLRTLGDEQTADWFWGDRLEAERATRANVQVSRLLREAGLNDDADRFAYRAQVRQRNVHLLRGRLGRWLFSWVLYALAGYGYRPLRTVFWYLAVIASFAFAYFSAVDLTWNEALVVSLTAFHGRGFFITFQPGDPLAALAAGEAVIGLLIEISFIAIFTQRFFGVK